MKGIKVKRIDPGLPMPEYQTNGSVGFDFYCRKDCEILPGEIALIPGNLIIEVPYGYMLMVVSRSSTPIKKGLSMPHGFGVIDLDYHGPEDEIKIQVYNFRNEPVKISRGDRIAQGVFVRVDRFELQEETIAQSHSRGGFGSTDKVIYEKR